MKLASLVAKEGQRVVAEGFAVAGEGREGGISFSYLERHNLVQLPGPVGLPLTACDGVRLPERTRPARVRGTWDGERIWVDQVGAAMREFDGPVMEVSSLRYADPPPRDADLDVALEEHYSNGNIVGTGVDFDSDGELVMVIDAHDAAALQQAVARFPRIRVIQNPWDRTAYRRIRKLWLLAERQDVLWSLTVGLSDEHGHHRVEVGLLRLTRELAERAAGIPEGPMPLDLLMRPDRS